jgi:hypothetical protein
MKTVTSVERLKMSIKTFVELVIAVMNVEYSFGVADNHYKPTDEFLQLYFRAFCWKANQDAGK